MIFPSINELMKTVDSKYTLVVATAKRARMIEDGAPKLVECDGYKSVSVAINEIAEGKIKYIRKEKNKS